MSKYIDADEFVKIKREWYCEQCLKRKGMKRGKLQFVYEIGGAPCRACDVDDMISDIEDFPAADVEPKRKWIPVTERLPEPVSAQTRRKTKPVLLYSPKGGFYVGWYFGKDYRGHHLFRNRTSRDSLQYITTEVTHWMLLPEPPEE
jgi:hypothetical protein